MKGAGLDPQFPGKCFQIFRRAARSLRHIILGDQLIEWNGFGPYGAGGAVHGIDAAIGGGLRQAAGRQPLDDGGPCESQDQDRFESRYHDSLDVRREWRNQPRPPTRTIPMDPSIRYHFQGDARICDVANVSTTSPR